MGKKKGGAKNKLARMSEEERTRYLQHRADMEEEARRRKQQLIALYMKNKLKREEAFSRLNLAKINQEWRSILRQIKCNELRNEIIEAERLFNQALDQKSRIIRRLLSDLDESEELFANLSQSQMENVDRLIDLQNERMEFFKQSYINDKETILKEWEQNCKMFKEARIKSQIGLECVYFALEDDAIKMFKNFEEKHLNRMDDLQSTMTIKLETITKSREKQLESLWSEYQKILNEYVKHTDDFHKEYTLLRENDDHNTKLIRLHCFEVTKATNELAELKIIADNTSEESEFQIKYLEKYRHSLNEKYLELKRNLEFKLKFDEIEFREMTVCSHNAVEELKKIYKKGESTLQLSGVCRRLETEREKILPFGHVKREAFINNVEDLKKLPPQFQDNNLENWYNLEKFWIRVNNARLDKACLQEEKTILERENIELKAQLKDYLTSVTIATGPNGVMEDRLNSRPNSMKIEKVVHIELTPKKPGTAPSKRSNCCYKKRQIQRPITCIEANLSNAIRSERLVIGKINTEKIIRTIDTNYRRFIDIRN